jgi:acyl carrier protein
MQQELRDVHDSETAGVTDLRRRVVRAYIVKNFLLGAEGGFGDDDSLLEAGVVDSTSALELVEFLEKKFDISISDIELSPENFDTISRISQFVARKTAAMQPA